MTEITMEEIEKWVPLSKMEHADERLYKERVSGAYNVKLPHQKLDLIPYMGVHGEVIENRYPELIGLCPVTFLADTYNLHLRYIPDKHIPELKSLRFYFMDYMKLPISHEHLASRIFRDIKEQIKPKKIYLKLEVSVRGGIYTTCFVGDKELSVLEPSQTVRA